MYKGEGSLSLSISTNHIQMSITLSCTTQLDAVNVCLEAIGEQPVNVIPTSGVSEATVANAVVKRISREVQNTGLHCNSEEDYPFMADIDGNVVIPQNVLHIDPTDNQLDYVVRGNRLYDRSNHTFKITTSYVKCDVVWLLPFEDLPEHARHYIAVVAARTFQRDFLGSTNLNAISREDELRARLNFMRNEDRTDDKTFLDGHPVNNILNRVV